MIGSQCITKKQHVANRARAWGISGAAVAATPSFRHADVTGDEITKDQNKGFLRNKPILQRP